MTAKNIVIIYLYLLPWAFQIHIFSFLKYQKIKLKLWNRIELITDFFYSLANIFCGADVVLIESVIDRHTLQSVNDWRRDALKATNQHKWSQMANYHVVQSEVMSITYIRIWKRSMYLMWIYLFDSEANFEVMNEI